MSSEKKVETPKQRTKKPADELTKTGKKDDIELSEKELGRVAGGFVIKGNCT
jgi:hypothetical protein